MNMPTRLIVALLLVLFGNISVNAQLPNCSQNLVYLQTETAMYTWNPAAPIASGVNPVLNSIAKPTLGFGGLAVSPNLNSSTAPSPTFYTIVNGIYNYHNGTSWVSTGHWAGQANVTASAAQNIGAGGGYIFNLDGSTGDVYRYNGTGNATLITTVSSFIATPGIGGGPWDLVCDCAGNFYVLRIQTPAYLNKYNSSGTLIQSWNIAGPPAVNMGGGFAIVGNNIYFQNTSGIWGGTINSSSTITFTQIPNTGNAFPVLTEDMGSCPIGSSVNASIDTGYYCGSGQGVKVKAYGFAPFQWTVLSGNATITGPGDSVYITPSVPTKIKLTDALGCGSGHTSDTVLVVPANPSLVAGGPDTVLGCGSYIDTLHAVFNSPVSWLPYNIAWAPAASVVSAGSTLTPVVSLAAPTTYVITVSTAANKGGCVWKDSVKTIPEDHSVNADYSFNIRYGCGTDTVDFTNLSTNATSYNWSFNDASGSTALSPSHVYNAQQIFNVVLISGNGICADTMTKQVDVTHPLAASFKTDKDSICQGATINFTNTSTTTVKNNINPSYYWAFGDGGTANTGLPSHQFNKAGVYNVMMVVNDFVPCADTAYRTILVDSAAFANFYPTDSALCQGQAIQFKANYLQLGNTGITWNFGEGDSISNMNPVIHSYELPGTYTVKLSATYRLCPDTALTKEIKIKAFPVIDLGSDTSLCPGANAIPLYDHHYHADVPQYVWSNGSIGPSIKAVEPGIYYATATVDGCSTTDSVEVFRDCYIDIPNSFTPNGDGINTYFFPRNLLTKGATRFSMKIFNRWGETIFETTNLNGRGWDGNFNGTPQPTGVYIYLIEADFTNGNKEKYQGNVTLLR